MFSLLNMFSLFNTSSIIMLVGGGMLAFHMLKSSTKPFMLAGVIGAIGLSAWSFWPSFRARAMPQTAVKSEADIAKKKVAAKKAAKKKAKVNHLVSSPKATIPPSGNPPQVKVTPQGSIPPSGKFMDSFQAKLRGNTTPPDPKAIAEGHRKQQARQRQRNAQKQKQRQLQLAQQPQQKLAQKQFQRQQKVTQQRDLRRQKLAQNQQRLIEQNRLRQQKLANTPNPMAGKWLPGIGMPHLGGHGHK